MTRECLHCHAAFEVRSTSPKQKYCSHACASEAKRGKPLTAALRRSTRVCPVCAGTFEVQRHSRRIYCSHPCATDDQRGNPRLVRELSDVDCAYLAGLLDGEGSIMLYRNGVNVYSRVAVFNTCVSVVEWCRDVTGAGSLTTENRQAQGHKDMVRWNVGTLQAAAILRQVRPYLKIKAENADIVLEFLERYVRTPRDADKGWQEKYRLRVCALNARWSGRRLKT
jgi:hypothetical protein